MHVAALGFGNMSVAWHCTISRGSACASERSSDLMYSEYRAVIVQCDRILDHLGFIEIEQLHD